MLLLEFDGSWERTKIPFTRNNTTGSLPGASCATSALNPTILLSTVAPVGHLA